MKTKNIVKVNISVSVTKTRTYEIAFDTDLVCDEEIRDYERKIDIPSFDFCPEKSEVQIKIKINPYNISFLNVAKIIAFLKMKYDTIPVLSNPNGIDVVEVSHNDNSEISDYVIDGDVTAVKFMINDFEDEHTVYLSD